MDGQLIARRSDLLEAEVDSELVALDVASGTCYGLNETGTRIWRMLAEPLLFGRLIEHLVQDYEVDPEICRAEVAALLRDLEQDGIVEFRAPGT